jgi:hypothetical protein
MVIKPRFATVTNFSGGLAAFTKHNNYSLSLWGLIDKTGKVVVTPRFTEFRNAQYNPQTGYMAQVKELSWAPRREIESPGGKVKLASRAPKHSLQTRAGVITERGEWIILPVFEYISEFENDLAEVFIRQGISTPNAPFRALINRNGKIVFVLKNFFKQSHEEQ